MRARRRRSTGRDCKPTLSRLHPPVLTFPHSSARSCHTYPPRLRLIAFSSLFRHDSHSPIVPHWLLIRSLPYTHLLSFSSFPFHTPSVVNSTMNELKGCCHPLMGHSIASDFWYNTRLIQGKRGEKRRKEREKGKVSLCTGGKGGKQRGDASANREVVTAWPGRPAAPPDGPQWPPGLSRPCHHYPLSRPVEPPPRTQVGWVNVSRCYYDRR